MTESVVPTASTPAIAGPPPRHGVSNAAKVAVVLVVVVVIIVGLGIANVLPGFHLNGGGGGGSGGKRAVAQYNVTFRETGLVSGASWSVTLDTATLTSTTGSVMFTAANGTHPYTIPPVTGYTAAPTRGDVVVAGSATSVTITFTATTTPPPASYDVLFDEVGLPAGATWSVTLQPSTLSSMGTTITFSEVNGTYAYSVAGVAKFTSNPSSGTVTVHGAATTVTVTFTAIPAATYLVKFSESGLPLGTSWSVTLNGSTHSSSGTAVTFTEPNGTYSFALGSVPGYTMNPSSGRVPVSGARVTVPVAFSSSAPPPGKGAYAVTFDQNGLPGNLTWAVSLVRGTLPSAPNASAFGESGQGTALELAAPNGTYSWYLNWMGPYFATPNQGTLTVAGHSVTVLIQFAPVRPTSMQYAVTFTESGLPTGATWYASVNGTTHSAGAGRPIAFFEVNGTYNYNVSEGSARYSSNTSGGTLFVDGAAVAEPVVFIRVYNVTFAETGLTGFVSWNVVFDGSLYSTAGTTAINLTFPNGSYPFTTGAIGYSSTPRTGTVHVNGGSVTIPITFRPLTSYAVRFTETGLPPTVFWNAELLLDGAPFGNGSYSTTNSLNISVPNGNYTWYVATFTVGYEATPVAGAVTVANAPATESVVFAAIPSGDSLIVFTEEQYFYTGLHGAPNGTSWNVTLGGVTLRTTGVFIAFLEPNGTYTYTIGPPAGYSALPSSGAITVNTTAPGFFFASTDNVYVAFYSGNPSPPPALGPNPGALVVSAGPPALAGPSSARVERSHGT